MRTVWAALLAGAAILCLWAWPYLGAYQLVDAARSHDPAGLVERIDEPALKRSLTRQIVSAVLRTSGRSDKMGSFQRGLANAVGGSVASPYLDQMLSPETLAALLSRGHIGTLTVGDRSIVLDRDLPTLPTVFQTHLFDVLLHSSYDGIASFRFSIPETANGLGDYGIHLRLGGLTWRLSGIDLPADVLDRIAADAIAAEKKSAEPHP